MVTKKIVKAKTSKKISTCKRMKIGRKIKEAKKKMRKEFKKMKELGTVHKRRKKKSLVVPNSFPEKKEMLLNMKAENEKLKQERSEKMRRCQQEKDGQKEKMNQEENCEEED